MLGIKLGRNGSGKLEKHSADEVEEDAIQHADLPSKVIAVIFVLAIAYFIGDSYFGLEEYYAGVPPWQLHFVTGLCTAMVAWLALNSGKSGAVQTSFVALLFGGGMALAAYPGLLRLNAWLDSAGPIRYEYTLGSNDTWSTPAGGPDLVFDIGSRYWNQFESGDVKDFQLREGGLGFAQINMAPLYTEQRAFYSDTSLSLVGDQRQDP